ncbi:hypothetical protein WJX72_010591 [[Myrmecia] bisecta]|uniref:Uncharacterized protein n=1 Tax=[Myrmecia] bisecta TaxID=41462 RepID=A0AAW1QGB1_9CHLO
MRGFFKYYIRAGEVWTEVRHNSGQIYYWNEQTGETTALGEPKPRPEGRRVMRPLPVGAAAPSLLGLVGVGAGIGLVFGIIGKIF